MKRYEARPITFKPKLARTKKLLSIAFEVSLVAYQSRPINATVKPRKSNADKRYSF